MFSLSCASNSHWINKSTGHYHPLRFICRDLVIPQASQSLDIARSALYVLTLNAQTAKVKSDSMAQAAIYHVNMVLIYNDA